MQFKLSASCLALAVGFAAVAAFPAAAVPITPGVSVSLPGTTVFDRPELAGFDIADRLVNYAFTDGSGSGQIQESVSREASGTLDFYFRVLPDAGSTANVQDLRIAGFGDFITDADYRIDGLGTVMPIAAFAFTSPFNGDINFRFGEPSDRAGGLAPSAGSSSFIFIHTTATQFNTAGFVDVATGFASVISNGNSTFAPVAGVPEPASWALLIMGFGGLGAMLRRRQRHATTAA